LCAARWFGEEFGQGNRERLGRFRVDKGQGEGKTMVQLQAWRSVGSQRLWLSTLIDAMEAVSRPETRAVPCDQRLLAAFRAQLARPASAGGGYASTYSLRN
jgi:hypothetical protein